MAAGTRAALLKAALRTVGEEGLAGATTRRIAELAGVNEVTLFRQFGSKTELLKAALLEEALVLEQAAATPTGDVEADLVRLVTEFSALTRGKARLLVMAYLELPRWPEFSTVMERQEQALRQVARVFEHYQGTGVLVAEEPMAAAVSLLGPLVFVAMGETTAPGRLPVLEPASYVRLFLGGRLGAGPARARGKAVRQQTQSPRRRARR